jgi:hypothetical protein
MKSSCTFVQLCVYSVVQHVHIISSVSDNRYDKIITTTWTPEFLVTLNSISLPTKLITCNIRLQKLPAMYTHVSL